VKLISKKKIFSTGWFGFEKKIFCGPSVTVTGRRKALPGGFA
jgi:hypothetical protein